jgi:general secretion pathway protein C
MQQLPLERSGFFQTAAVFAFTLAALALLGMVLAYWTWAWFAPRAEPRMPLASVDAGSTAAAGQVFGQAARDSAAPTGIAMRLLGIVAASRGRQGNAVVQLDGKQILAVTEGGDVAPGIRLAEVHPDHVVLERGGARETLTWPDKRLPGAGAPLAK